MALTPTQIINLYERNVNTYATPKDIYLVGTALNDAILEIEAIIKTTGTTGYKEFSYDVDDNIIGQSIYSDTAGLVLAFTVTYDYTGDDLTLITVVRASDSFSYTKTFVYDVGGNLTSITIEEV